jgi:hypothetical protein
LAEAASEISHKLLAETCKEAYVEPVYPVARQSKKKVRTEVPVEAINIVKKVKKRRTDSNVLKF